MLKYDISPNVKGLIFDLDGTLVDTMPYHFEAWQKTAEQFGLSITKEFMRENMGSSAKLIAKRFLELHNKQDEIDTDLWLSNKYKNYAALINKVTPIKEVFDIAKKYHGKIPMAIGTGGSKKSVEMTLEQTGVGKYFDIVVCAEDVENHKPAPDTFLQCAEKIGVSPEHCEVFEDGELGLKAGENAGMIVTDVRSWYDPTW